ncbi:MAG: hypothetical protein ACE5L7_08440 [Candidatus Aminicenantales bacterium]
MKKRIGIYGLIFLLASFSFQVQAKTQPDEKLFREAKILLFDKEWKSAQEKLEELLRQYPESRWHPFAVFYLAKCLQEQKGREEHALSVYKDYIKLKDRNKSLVEESEISIIDLAYALYNKGQKSFLKEIESRLASSSRVIKYYAAFKLSYIKDKKIASKGIPVLKEIINSERDDELRDRAKIAMLRVDPEALKDFEEERYEKRAVILKIRVYETATKKTRFSLNIPWALADLVFSAIGDEEKDLMREKGYDLDRIRGELTRFRGNIIVIEGDTITIKMWID